MQKLVKALKQAEHLVVFTGAGVSTLSGLPDFRGQDGLYAKFDADKIFSLDYFYHDPAYYYTHTKDLIYSSDTVKPSLVHTEIARLEYLGYVKAVVTQNIDMLHQKAGTKLIYEIHGSPQLHHCLSCRCEYKYNHIQQIVMQNEVPHCDCGGLIKPDITFFGEMLPEDTLYAAVKEAEQADVMLVLGSSLVVQPAASIPFHTVDSGGELIIINRGFTSLDHFAVQRYEDLESCFMYIAEHL